MRANLLRRQFRKLLPSRRARQLPRRRSRRRRAPGPPRHRKASACACRPNPGRAQPPVPCQGHWPFARRRSPAEVPTSCGTGQLSGRAAPTGSASMAFLSMSPGKGALAPAPAVEQPETDLTDKAYPLRNPRQGRGDGRFPGPWHHQGGPVASQHAIVPPTWSGGDTASRERGRS